tara:strand:- start:121 stop:534 length:414 start_codon:yes stop_codon:yes gene_type:complete
MKKLIKNIKAGKISSVVFFTIVFFSFFTFSLNSDDSNFLEGKFVEIKILDKVSSKNSLLKIKIGEQKKFKNLLIKSLKCKNSEFDDNPEITAYLQVKDLKNKKNDEVFVFNGWTFSSGPAIKPFDHPVYDLWLIGCY